MFKIESYLTPIILNYVARYVKDFRPQDAQLSLWQGEVILQNLNMRLDVLENELNLPFDLLSGHIHELSILVPWTKITSEPIKITINTIEFILKIKNSEERAPCLAEMATKSGRKTQQLQQEEGGLVNKIIKNIEIQCHNIILKLIVEDIVLSMNVQLLSFSAADENWAPAMVEINSVNVLMRKLIRISDLTICLDKRNEAGQIEVCQEPLLYRSNLECRILDKYNAKTKTKYSTQRIGIYTDLLDSNVSSLQFPMIMRLYEILSNLNACSNNGPRSSNANTEKSSPNTSIASAQIDNNEVFMDVESDIAVNQSYFSWFWNALPTLDFEIFDGEETPDASQNGHTRDIGVYIKEFNMTLKHAEFVNDSIVGNTKRLHYAPIVRASLGGIYFEKVSAEEIGWSSIKSGLTNIIIEPLGEYSRGDVETNALLTCSSSFDIGNAFIDKSLFDKQCLIADKGWGVTNYTEYCNRITDEYLLFRGPVLAFDSVKYIMSKQNHTSDDATPSDGISDKRCQYRLLSSGITFRYNQVFQQVKHVINDYVKSYDYPEYHAEGSLEANMDNISKLHPPQMENYEALMKHIPFCTYRFDLKRIRMEIYPHFDPPADSGLQKPMTGPKNDPLNQAKQTLRHHFVMQLEYLGGQLTRPMNPNMVVYTACQLPLRSLPQTLLYASYNNYTLNLKQIYMALNDGKSPDTFSKVLVVPSATISYSTLIMPHLWETKPRVPMIKIQADCKQFHLEFSRRELFIIDLLRKCIDEYKPKYLCVLAKHNDNCTLSQREVKLHNQFCQFQIIYRNYRKATAWNFSLKSMLSRVTSRNYLKDVRYDVLSTESSIFNNRDIWLELQMQLPAKETDIPTVVGVWMEKFYISISVPFLEFLNYNESEQSLRTDVIGRVSQNDSLSAHGPMDMTILPRRFYATASNQISQSMVPRLSRNSASSDRNMRRISHPEETIHFSSDRDDKVTAATSTTETAIVDSGGNKSFQYLQMLRNVIMHIEIVQSELCFAEYLPEVVQYKSRSCSSRFLEHTTIKLPEICVDSNDANRIVRSDVKHLVIPDKFSSRNEFNWTVTVKQASVQNHTQSDVDIILKSMQLNISIALTVKSVRRSTRLKANKSKSRTSLTSKRMSAVESRIGEFVFTSTDSEEESDEGSGDKEKGSIHSHYDRGVQISKSCESISLKNIPLMEPILSSVSLGTYASSSVDIEADTKRHDLGARSSYSMGSLSLGSRLSEISVSKFFDETVNTFSLHADTTTPIHFLLSVKKIKTAMCNFEVLWRVYNSVMSDSNRDSNYTSRGHVEIFTPGEENANIKAFMEMETSSAKTNTSIYGSVPPTSSANYFLCQLTITKIILEVKNNEESQVADSGKVLLELEDLLSSVDIQRDYTKYTFKIGQSNLTYMKFLPSEGIWSFNDCLHIKMLPVGGNPMPILNIVATIVTSKEFHNRIGAKHKGVVNKQILEICLYVEAIQIICDLEQLAGFIDPLCALWRSYNPCKYKSANGSRVLTSENLPILYLESKGLVLYLPAKAAKEYSNVGILKIENIKISPDLKNPLQRNPLRHDVFQKASKLGILHIPGSAVEDRQYELILEGISFASADWYQTSQQMRDQSTNFLVANPALEWNNQNRRSQVKLWKLFSNFKFVCIYAPCMTYKNVLICGSIIEFNCASDFVATINTHQLNLISCIIIHLNNISNILNMSVCSVMVNQGGCVKSLESFQESERIVSISTYSRPFTLCESMPHQSSGDLEKRRSLPHEPHNPSEIDISHLTSIDEINVSKLARTSDSGFHSCLSWQSKTQTSISNRFNLCTSGSSLLHSNEHDAVGKVSTIVANSNREIPRSVALITGNFHISLFAFFINQQIPMIAVDMSQPSFIITQGIYDRSMQVTLFGLTVQVADSHKADHTNSEVTDDEEYRFPHTIMETKQGKLGSSGIPPPFFSCKTYLSKKQLLEIDIDILKSIKFSLSENYVHQLLRHVITVNQALLENPCFEVRHKKPILHGSKIKLICLHFFNASRFHCKLNYLEFKFFQNDTYNFKLTCGEVIANVKFITRPEKATAKLSINDIHLTADDKTVVHPLNLAASVDFIKEPWHVLPLICASIHLNVVQIDIGIIEISKVRHALNDYLRLTSQLSEEWETFLRNRPREAWDNIVKRDDLIRIICPPVLASERKKTEIRIKRRQRKEFYQDDLRAGAFQFLETEMDTVLPLPYQIQIITKKFGIVCWRYPQPRRICKIQTSPIPLASPNPVHIKCRMEYFSEPYDNFLYFCEFWLSETVSKELELPERTICANIWRIVIMETLIAINGEYFDANENNYDIPSIQTSSNVNELVREREKFKFIFHPKLLVGCMRIDTSFQSELVPKTQVLIKCNLFKFNILNNPVEDPVLPEFLQGYTLSPEIEISHTFMNLSLEHTSFFLSLLSPRDFSINYDTTFSVKCIDYGYLNMISLVEESTLCSFWHINENKNCIDVDVIHDKIRLNFGPSIFYTLLSAKRQWENALDSSRFPTQHVFITKFVIVNQTFSIVGFGQTGTNERIQLYPKQVYMYSFHSDFCKQELTFFIAVDGNIGRIETSQTVPISLKFNGTVSLQTIRIGNKCLIIKSQKLSATQIYVLIKGQLELISLVPHDLRVEFRRLGKNYDGTLEYPIEKTSRCTFFRNIQKDSLIFMRIKFMDGIVKGRSGDIPLKPNRHLPWLVKVPYQDNNFISFWVRVLREDLPDVYSDEDFKPQRILVTIWPVFEIQSMLSGGTIAQERSGIEKVFAIAPKGGRYLLNVPATHLTEHEVEFNFRFPLDPEISNEYVLTLKSIDWNDFFWYDEKLWRIEYALQELPAIKHVNWPVNDFEEMRLKRLSRCEAMTTVNYNCVSSRDYSCTLRLKLSPWGMFINSTGMIISVCDYDTQARLTVESNAIEMMLAIKTAFTLEIRYGNTWISSLPVYFKNTSKSAIDKYHVALEDVGSEIVILCGGEVVKFVLDYKIEEERRIFIVRSKYNVTNFTKRKLYVFPFTFDHKESVTRGDIKKLDAQVRKKYLQPVNSMKNCIGQTLDSFFDLCARNSARSSDTAFINFVSFKICDDSELSMPIPLAIQFPRKCFSLQDGSESIALVALLVEQNGIFYLSIFDDNSPAILLNNQTNIRLMVAQTYSLENSKVIRTTPEYNGKHFVWNQLVFPYSKCYYTPPGMYKNYPDVESTHFSLSFALWKDSSTKSCIHWSKPIRTDKMWEKYLHVPNHGDVKVIICDKHNIIRVSIYYTSQKLEFSIKDLRSRLVTSPSPPSPPPFTDLLGAKSSTSITTLFSALSEDSLVKTKPSDTCAHFCCDAACPKFDIKFRYFIKEINLNLNTDCRERDYRKNDIFALYADDCMLAFDADIDNRKLKIIFANLQIENQLFSSGKYDFPVVVCSQKVYMHKSTLPDVHFVERIYHDLRTSEPMITLDIDLFDDEVKISAIECSISPIRAYIEDAYLNDLLDAFIECIPTNCVYLPESESVGLTLLPGQMLLPHKVAEQSLCLVEPLKLKSFRIQPLNLLLSVHTSLRLYIALDHSPLSFSSYDRQHIVTVPLRFGQSVGMHYISGAIFGAGWVVGSLEILGSPSGLARCFSTGLRDFVSLPVRGLLRGPWGFIVGITQGSASLLRNITAGTVNSMTKLASSVARNLDRLSLDRDHIERTEALRRSRPQGFTEGFSQGITGLGISLLGAVGGIARHTLEARTAGEVVSGVGKGLVGAVTKPLGGAAELLALTGQGVLQSVGFNTMPQQREKGEDRNIILQSSDYRIWKLLSGIATTDQILFQAEVSLEVHHLLKRAYVMITNVTFVIVEAKWDKLALAIPVHRVELIIDEKDRTLVRVRLTREPKESTEKTRYTNERIMSFLRSSPQTTQQSLLSDDNRISSSRPNSTLKYPQFLSEYLPSLTERDSSSDVEWIFYIKQYLGEYLLEYLKFLHNKY